MNTIRTRNFLLPVFCLILAFLLAVPTQAWAIVEGDQTLLTEEEIANATAQGQLDTYEESTYGLSDISTMSDKSTMATVKGNKVKAFSGADRFETAALQATYGWKSSEYAIVTGYDGWPDALSGTSLAGALDCPILITDKNSLSQVVATTLGTLKVKKVIILGSPQAVGNTVVSDIKALGISSVERLGGVDRFETQLRIYEYGRDKKLWSADRVIVASGMNFSDALSGAPLAAKGKYPIFLTDSNGELSVAQEKALVAGAQSAQKLFKSSLILGSSVRVSANTEGFMWLVSQLSSGQSQASIRLGGAHRYDTSAKVAKWGVDNMGLTYINAAFSSGEVPYDSLGGGVLQARENSVLLLVYEGATSSATDLLKGKGATHFKFFGGKPAISNKARLAIANALGIAYSEITGLKVYVDAGHGQNSSNDGKLDVGAVSGKYQEYKLTATLANKVGSELGKKGMSVYVNDTGGWYKLRQARAEALGCDLFVSIHFNAFDGKASGSESYIHSYNAASGSAALQNRVHKAMVEGVGLADRGKKKAEFAVCGGNVPAVLLEIAFIDNSTDMAKYNGRVDIVASKIAAGIAN